MTEPIVVAIDGPAGAGKSSVARRLAGRLGVPYLDTGAMYRAIGLAVLDAGLDPADRSAVEALAAAVDVALERRGDGRFEVLLDGAAVEDRIRTQAVGEAASAIAAHPGVRRVLVARQQDAARRFGGVLEGRDIGTHVFPDTPYKFFLDANAEVRSRRRFEQLAATGRTAAYEQVAEELARRDHRDRSRDDSPLTCDSTYTVLDATDLSIDEVVEVMARVVEGSIGLSQRKGSVVDELG
jgi:CMP/dCMP kinase